MMRRWLLGLGVAMVAPLAAPAAVVAPAAARLQQTGKPDIARNLIVNRQHLLIAGEENKRAALRRIQYVFDFFDSAGQIRGMTIVRHAFRHVQHGLIAHFAKFRCVYQRGFRHTAESR